MKKLIIEKWLFLTMVTGILCFTNCSKYDDGPSLSLKTKSSRLCRNWEVVKIDHEYADGVEIYLQFKDNGDFIVQVIDDLGGGQKEYMTFYGDWQWEYDKEALEIDLEDEDPMVWWVQRLTSSELWFEDEDHELWECKER